MLSLRKLFITSALLCATIGLSAQGPHAKASRASSFPAAGTSAVTCMPGLVFRCNQFGCFCLPPA